MFRGRILANRLSRGVSARKASSLVAKVNQSATALPHREAIRYEEKDYKFTAGSFLSYADAHGNALLEYGVKEGDVLGLWLPECAEKHLTMLAGAKAGFKVVSIDPTITDIPSIREFLRLSNCKLIYFWPTRNEVSYPMLLRKAIPELYYYDNSQGQHFHSKYFPQLKYFVHLGYDNEFGCLTYHEMMLRNPECPLVADASAKIADDTPVFATIAKSAEGKVTMSPWITHKQALENPAFLFAKKLVDQVYLEIPQSP